VKHKPHKKFSGFKGIMRFLLKLERRQNNVTIEMSEEEFEQVKRILEKHKIEE